MINFCHTSNTKILFFYQVLPQVEEFQYLVLLTEKRRWNNRSTDGSVQMLDQSVVVLSRKDLARHLWPLCVLILCVCVTLCVLLCYPLKDSLNALLSPVLMGSNSFFMGPIVINRVIVVVFNF